VPLFADVIEHALSDEHDRRAGLGPCEQLGVGPDADPRELAEAHHRLKDRFQPAIFSRYGAPTQELLQKLNDLIDAAYAELKKK
jgi:hypothetical protein